MNLNTDPNEDKKLNEGQTFSNSMFQRIKDSFQRKNFHSSEGLDKLTQIKRERHSQDKWGQLILALLMILLIANWKWGISMIRHADQLENDLKEQAEVIQVEKANQLVLKRLGENQKELLENLRKIQMAIPKSDEKSEEMIAMLEDMALQDGMIIDAIGIRLMPESQMNYDDLIGVVDIFEYSFSVESHLPNILNFINAIRSSYRLIDIVAMEIEENQGLYRASFLINAYHLKNPNNV